VLQHLVVAETELRGHRAAELERRLTLARQLREGRPSRPSFRARLLLGLGDALIALGQSIQPQVRTA
jgi:hypothetical protein